MISNRKAFTRLFFLIGLLLALPGNPSLQAKQSFPHQIEQEQIQRLNRGKISIPTLCRVEQSAVTGLVQRVSPPPLRTPTLAILVEFSDRQGVGNEVVWNNRFFRTTNSVRDYFREVSYFVEGVQGHDMHPAEESAGSANNGIVGWYRITWGLEGTRYDEHPATASQREGVTDWEKSPRRINEQIAVAAIQAADADIQFSMFDTDTNGYISSDELHVVFVLAGYELTTGAPRNFSTWRHHTALGTYNNLKVDGVRLFDEQIPGSDIGGGFCLVGEVDFQRRNEMDSQIEFGLIAHELGHDLGLPDLYDTDDSNGNSAGIGRWGLMAHGDGLGDRFGNIPAHLSAWSKTFLKWVQPKIVEGNTFAQQIFRVEDTPEIFLLPVDGQNFPGTEYFLIENRQKVFYDRELPGSGLLIWHIDPAKLNNGDNNDETHKLVDLECADQTGIGHTADADPLDRFDPAKGAGSRGTAKNPWFAGNKTDFRIFNQSVPDSRDYQGHNTSVEVRNISVSANIMTADLIVNISQTTVASLPITNTVSNAENPAIAIEPNGTSHIVWQDARIGNWEIFFSKLDANGAFLLQDLRITDTAGSSTKPDVSTDANGNTYIVWRERDEIFFCVLDAATGLKVVSDVQVSPGDADNPAISTIASGRSHIVWQRRQISLYYVYFAQVDAAGQKIGSDLRLADWDIIGAINNYPAIDNDASGDSYILWRYRNTGILPLDHALFYAKINDDRSIAARFRVLNQPKADYTAIAVASPYLFLVHSDDRGAGRGIFSITNIDQDYRVDAGGVNAIQTTAGYDATQNAYIAWSDERDGNREIYLAHINPSNQKEGPDLRITATPGNSSWPDIDMDGAGNYFMVWQDNSDGDWDIWMTRGPAEFTPPGQSDLTISHVEGPTTAIAGTQEDISVTVNLSGDPLTSGAFVLVRVYASVDDVFDNSDLLIGESTETQFLITTLNIIGGATESISCSLPQAAGSYRYIAVVDPVDFHRESDETNNIFAGNRVTTNPPGKVWHIATTGDDDSGTGSPDKPFARIQKGIDQATHGDTVLVSPGVYFESINFLGKNIVVGSHFLRTQDESFLEQTVIDASQEPTERSVVYIVNGESEQAELVGLTLQNGRGSTVAYPDHQGGGISLHRGARPKIRYCHIKNNTSSYQGSGIFCRQATPLIAFCTISGNSASSAGGGIIFIDTSPRVENCTIVDNTSPTPGGGIYNHNASPTIINTIIWGNRSSTSKQIDNVRGSSPNITFSNIQGGYAGEGNIDADPIFCAQSDYRLNENSPCIGAGANGENMGANPVGCNVVGEQFILSFPLASDPYSMEMTAIFDHSMSTPYENPPDGFVVAFSGDSGIAALGYRQRNGKPFILNGNYYKGLEHSKILEYEGHSGIDYDANIGSIVYATADGEVTKVVKNKPDDGQGEGYGNYIQIQHAESYVTLYGHLKQNSTDLKEKDMVTRGAEIALSGNSGKSTGDHLHFEVRKNGTVVDPYGWQGFGTDPYTLKTGVANAFLWDITTDQTEWHFDETFEKWRTRDALNQGVNVALGGKWVLDPGSDPGAISPALTNIDASQFKKIELRMAANGNGESTTARLFFKTSLGQQFKEARSAEFTPNVIRDGSQRTYTADLSGHALWQGQIVEIRIDPIENGDPGDTSDLLYIDKVKFVNTATAIAEQSDSQPPSQFHLSQNYPNPFTPLDHFLGGHSRRSRILSNRVNPETTIEFALPEPGRVVLTIYNTLGQVVRVVVDEKKPAGFWTVKWDGRDRNNQPVPSGIYLYHMVAGRFTATRKLMVVR